jgi:hypothetical protein
MKTVSDILGPWEDPDWDSGLIARLKAAWDKPIDQLSNEELATFLRQDMAVQHILPTALHRVEAKIDDDTEMYEGELQAAVQAAKGRHQSSPANAAPPRR